jgi:hypothetical protein
MKKILLIVGVSVFLFASRYSIVAEYSYMKGCVGKNEKMINYCACTLNAIENKYSLKEFILITKDKEKFKNLIKYAVGKCIDKLDIDEITK